MHQAWFFRSRVSLWRFVLLLLPKINVPTRVDVSWTAIELCFETLFFCSPVFCFSSLCIVRKLKRRHSCKSFYLCIGLLLSYAHHFGVGLWIRAIHINTSESVFLFCFDFRSATLFILQIIMYCLLSYFFYTVSKWLNETPKHMQTRVSACSVIYTGNRYYCWIKLFLVGRFKVHFIKINVYMNLKWIRRVTIPFPGRYSINKLKTPLGTSIDYSSLFDLTLALWFKLLLSYESSRSWLAFKPRETLFAREMVIKISPLYSWAAWWETTCSVILV